MEFLIYAFLYSWHINQALSVERNSRVILNLKIDLLSLESLSS